MGKQVIKRDGEAKASYGPKMLALPNDRWRRFVTEWLDGAKGGHGGSCKGYSAAARRAGFTGTDTTIYSTARHLAHDQRIQEAIQEEARKRLTSSLPMAVAALDEILADPGHKDRLGAVKSVLDRTGLHEVHEIDHKHEFIANDPAMLERVRQIAVRLNIPVEQLLGRTALEALPGPVTDAEFKEVEDDRSE